MKLPMQHPITWAKLRGLQELREQVDLAIREHEAELGLVPGEVTHYTSDPLFAATGFTTPKVAAAKKDLAATAKAEELAHAETTGKKTRKSKMSAEGRKSISEAQKKRWQKQPVENVPLPPAPIDIERIAELEEDLVVK